MHGLLFLKEKLGVMHRDIKPSNVLLGAEGEIKLTDFGMAKVMDQSLLHSHVGCERYLAPERLDPSISPNDYGTESDVWSYGVALVELGMLKFPYDYRKNHAFQLFTKIVRDPAPVYDNFNVVLTPFLTYFSAHPTPHAPCDVPYLVPMLSHRMLSCACNLIADIMPDSRLQAAEHVLRGVPVVRGVMPQQEPRAATPMGADGDRGPGGQGAEGQPLLRCEQGRGREHEAGVDGYQRGPGPRSLPSIARETPMRQSVRYSVQSHQKNKKKHVLQAVFYERVDPTFGAGRRRTSTKKN